MSRSVTVAAWHAATTMLPQGKQDTNRIVGDPKFTSATDFHLEAGARSCTERQTGPKT